MTGAYPRMMRPPQSPRAFEGSKSSALGSMATAEVNVIGALAVPWALIFAPRSMTSAGAGSESGLRAAWMVVPASIVRTAPGLTNT
eukprot:scaffold50485_cov31-Prasinocladus_malaysianus.AAC.1